MIDIQFIRDNPQLVQEKSKQKGYDVDIDQLLGFDSKRKELLSQVEDLRRQRNQVAESSKGQKPSEEQIAKGKELKEKLGDLEHKLAAVEMECLELLEAVPNMPLDDVPVGDKEEDNLVVREWGEKPKFDFDPKPHWEIAEERDLVDKERAAKIAGSRFAYIKGDLVRLQFAIIQFVMASLANEELLSSVIKKENLNITPQAFTPILPPAMLRTAPYTASARLNAEETTYKMADDDLWLNASAEHTLCTMYWEEILPEELLPIRYIGYSTSFRREAGTYGKDTEGIIRLHQFDKLEMEVFSTADTGPDEHKFLIAIQEYLVQQLSIPYRYIQKSTFDIGKPNASGVDLECWYPGQDKYIETHTADYMTDYQARDLKTRVRDINGQLEFAHTNDATAFAMSRILAAIIENYQTADGRVKIPEVLHKYLENKEVI